MAILGDIRFALRTMASNRTTTIVAIVALSLGMGANATVFSIASGALFKNMPFVGDDILYLATRDLAHASSARASPFRTFWTGESTPSRFAPWEPIATGG